MQSKTRFMTLFIMAKRYRVNGKFQSVVQSPHHEHFNCYIKSSKPSQTSLESGCNFTLTLHNKFLSGYGVANIHSQTILISILTMPGQGHQRPLLPASQIPLTPAPRLVLPHYPRISVSVACESCRKRKIRVSHANLSHQILFNC